MPIPNCGTFVETRVRLPLRYRWFSVVAVPIILLIALWPRTAKDPPPGNLVTPNAGVGSAVTVTVEPVHNGPELQTDIDTPAQAGEKHSTLLNEQAMNAWYSGDLREAMTLFEQAIVAAPDDPVPHTNYGRLLTLMVIFDRAIPLLERARDLQPENAQTWLDLATAYQRAQLFSKSWEAQAQAAKLVGASSITRDAQGRFVVTGTTLSE